MKAKTEMAAQRGEGGAREQQNGESPNIGHLSGKPTFAQNLMGTIKVLAIAGLVIAALWGLDRLVSSK